MTDKALGQEQALRRLVKAADDYFSTLPGEGVAQVRAGMARFAHAPFTAGPVQPIRFPDDLEQALSIVASEGRPALAQAIRDALPYLCWITYDRYPEAEIGPAFGANHAFASFLGDGAPLQADDFDLGLFLIRPNVLYRDHRHAAPELYAPMTGPHGWRFSPGERLEWKPAHEPVWNPAFRHHATKTGDVPFLCLFGWTRDVSAPATVIACPDWDELERQSPP